MIRLTLLTALLLSGCIDQGKEFTLASEHPCKGIRQEVNLEIQSAIKSNSLTEGESVKELLGFINLAQDKTQDCLATVFDQSDSDGSDEVKRTLASTLSFLGDVSNVLTVNPLYCDLKEESCVMPYLEGLINENK